MRTISNEELRIQDVPGVEAEWLEILQFAQTFDGYECWGSFERCAEVAAAKDHGTLTTLRTCLFFEHRRWRNGDEGPPDRKTLAYWRTLVRKIRLKLEQRGGGTILTDE